MAVAVAVAVAMAGLIKRFFNHIQKDYSINVWGYVTWPIMEAYFRQQKIFLIPNIARIASEYPLIILEYRLNIVEYRLNIIEYRRKSSEYLRIS